mmetsp:Transcript_29309/g.73630  ORF Transcript_29309/g.73630 Transcript_29309/m.73630 type:complete len:243 (-) Transcript_29309:888-1616(-)
MRGWSMGVRGYGVRLWRRDLPSRGQQQRGLGGSIRSRVLGGDHGGLVPPNQCLAIGFPGRSATPRPLESMSLQAPPGFEHAIKCCICSRRDAGGQRGVQRAGIAAPEHLALAVRVVVDVYACHARRQDPGRGVSAQHHGVAHQEHRGRGVHGRHPHQAAPADVVPRAVMHDVHGLPVARLPPEKLGDVHVHQQHRNGHGVGQEPGLLVLLHGVAQHQDAPPHHPDAAVGPGLDVEVLPDARV